MKKYQEEKPVITNFCITGSPEGEKTINMKSDISTRRHVEMQGFPWWSVG